MSGAEALGFDSIWLSEHHFRNDAPSTSPLLLAAALAGRTKRVRIGTNILILPLHHPVRLAEEAATLAILSGGRFDLGIGAGYMPEDFDVFGRQLKYRPSLMEEGVAIMRLAWSGERFHFKGRRWQLPELVVRPAPGDRAVPIFMGGFAPAAIERAARIADGFVSGVPASIPVYRSAMERLGKPAEGRVVINQWAVIAEDPERTWATVGRHALERLNFYVRNGGLGDEPPFRDEQDVLERGAYMLWDGRRAVEELRGQIISTPEIRDLQLFAQLPGESVEDSTARLEYIAAVVLPAVRRDVDEHRELIRTAPSSPAQV
jgi:alkanesulfonate monooxygenase SsuD/methylene tetrahydromethanopterin reductase-like flavin-dependent oxidoreductase (luciferase family)